MGTLGAVVSTKGGAILSGGVVETVWPEDCATMGAVVGFTRTLGPVDGGAMSGSARLATIVDASPDALGNTVCVGVVPVAGDGFAAGGGTLAVCGAMGSVSAVAGAVKGACCWAGAGVGGKTPVPLRVAGGDGSASKSAKFIRPLAGCGGSA